MRIARLICAGVFGSCCGSAIRHGDVTTLAVAVIALAVYLLLWLVRIDSQIRKIEHES
jgi:hypothetical protein